jgi:hypothetical protein
MIWLTSQLLHLPVTSCPNSQCRKQYRQERLWERIPCCHVHRVLISCDISDYPKRSPCSHYSRRVEDDRCERSPRNWHQILSTPWNTRLSHGQPSSHTSGTIPKTQTQKAIRDDYSWWNYIAYLIPFLLLLPQNVSSERERGWWKERKRISGWCWTYRGIIRSRCYCISTGMKFDGVNITFMPVESLYTLARPHIPY